MISALFNKICARIVLNIDEKREIMTTLLIRNVKDEFVLAFKSLAKGVGASYEAFVVETQTKKLSTRKEATRKKVAAKEKALKTDEISSEKSKKADRKPKETATKVKKVRKPRVSKTTTETQEIVTNK